jgi:hypothetical protein
VTGLLALPETVRGLPLHALVLHATVVLVPLAALGTLACAVWPAARRRYGGLVVLGALVATVLVPVTTASGENLRARLGAEELVREHARWGERLLPAMLVLLAAVLALVGLETLRRRRATADPIGPAASGPGMPPATPSRPASAGGSTATARTSLLERRPTRTVPASAGAVGTADRLRIALVVVAVLAVLAALVTLYVVFQTGESGARAVWGGR